jgi:hypothetical protein
VMQFARFKIHCPGIKLSAEQYSRPILHIPATHPGNVLWSPRKY